MIFAKVDVDLFTHPRVLRIPKALRAECVGVWTLALLYSRRHELDGFCPLEAIDQIARDKAVDQLVTVGLLARDEQDGVHGIQILRYADRNETKEDIEVRRADTLKRVTDHRDKKKRNTLQVGVTPRAVPGSDSDSGSDSALDLRPSRINPPAQSFQDSKGEPTSGTVLASVLRTPREKPEKAIEIRRDEAIAAAAALLADPSYQAGAKR